MNISPYIAILYILFRFKKERLTKRLLVHAGFRYSAQLGHYGSIEVYLFRAWNATTTFMRRLRI